MRTMPWTAGRPVGVALRVGDASHRIIGITVAEEGDSTVISVPAGELLGIGGDTLDEEGQQIAYCFVRVNCSSLVQDPTWLAVPTLAIAGGRMLKALMRAYYQQETELAAADAEMHSAQSETEPAYVARGTAPLRSNPIAAAAASGGMPSLAATYGPARGRRTAQFT